MRDEAGERNNIRCLCVCACDSTKSGVCVLFRMSGCITAQRDSDVPLTFTAGREKAWKQSGGGKRTGAEREEGMPQSDACRTI